MNIKINDSQQERILEGINQLKELNNDVSDTCPIRYEQLCAMSGLEYLLADIFNMELPKCKHNYAERWRSYKFKKSKGVKNDT
tara:strand:- start:24 stop:272 length:249 start_codon:yes stop_codon:yes gene_type:complete